jgi:GT2 family glycosyltransferase
MTQLPSVYILIPVHNRKTITLTCLETLQHHGDLDRYKVVVIDDGSTDGTAEAIQVSFPQVIILKGDGHLWWTGAITLGMEYAYQQEANYFIWLNDDTLPDSATLSYLVSACASSSRRIVTAQCYADYSYSQPTYGGRLVGGCKLETLAARPGQTCLCDVCSGNLVCLPRSLVDTIGYPPSLQTPQAWGDVVYTWWATKAGFTIHVLGDATAICPNNPLEEGWSLSRIPMKQRWQMLTSPKSSIYPLSYWFYCNQVYDWKGGILFIQVYLKLISFTFLRWIVPLPWLKSLKTITGNKSN